MYYLSHANRVLKGMIEDRMYIELINVNLMNQLLLLRVEKDIEAAALHEKALIDLIEYEAVLDERKQTRKPKTRFVQYLSAQDNPRRTTTGYSRKKSELDTSRLDKEIRAKNHRVTQPMEAIIETDVRFVTRLST
jgi:phosphate starvation-inducible protein PhoH